MKELVKGTLQAVLVAAILWLGSQVGHLVTAIRDNSNSIDQLYTWVNEHGEEHEKISGEVG